MPDRIHVIYIVGEARKEKLLYNLGNQKVFYSSLKGFQVCRIITDS